MGSGCYGSHPPREDEGGIFREETPNLLARHCQTMLWNVLGKVHARCATKQDPEDMFSKCAGLVSTQCTDEDYASIASMLSKWEKEFEDTFILFAKLTRKDPANARRVPVRVSIPPLQVFVKHVLRSATSDPFVLSYEDGFFDARNVQGRLLSTKMAVREALSECGKEYIYSTHEEEDNNNSKNDDEDGSEHGDDDDEDGSSSSSSSSSSHDGEDVKPSDSASQVSGHSSSRGSERKKKEREKGREREKEEKRSDLSSSRKRREKEGGKSRASVITSVKLKPLSQVEASSDLSRKEKGNSGGSSVSEESRTSQSAEK